MSRIVYSLLSVACFLTYANCVIPDYIHVCKRNNPDLAGCIKKSVEALRPKLKVGIPELDVPSVEPLHLDAIRFQTSSQGTHLATNLTNVVVWGASNFKILKIVPTFGKNRQSFRFEVTIPQLHVEGDYEVNSRVLLLEIKGKGPFNANITDYHFECLLKGEKVQRNGENHVEFEKMECNLVIGKATIRLDNLFDGNPVLGRATNDVINDNSEVFFEEIKPNLLNSVRQLFTDIANKITLHFTSEELFP